MSTISLADLPKYLPYLKALEWSRERRKWEFIYPDTGPLRRELYPMHLAFFRAGAEYRQRAAISANRVGKTWGIGAYEIACHATGRYPGWWEGRRFSKPVKIWVAGDTGQTVKDILQDKLIGPPSALGTGMIPAESIVKLTRKGTVPDAVETVHVRHAAGGRNSVITLKSYEQGREAFQGTEQDVIWLDEEPPMSIYTECLTRTMTTNGLIMLTFTPLLGLSETVLLFLPGGKIKAGESTIADEAGSKKYIVAISWDDVPHLDAAAKAELLATYPIFQRDARTKGIPQLGAGAVYPVLESEITVKDFEIPKEWPRAYGMDVGWNRTAVIWGAQDPQSKVIYLYSEHYQGREEPPIHAAAIRARGKWIMGVIDPASRGRGQKDGARLLNDYIDLGLNLQKSNNSLESGILEVWQLLSGGQLKVFESLRNWFNEFRIYRRDESGHIVKENDHLQDACRYFIISGRKLMRPTPKPRSERQKITTSAWS